MHVDLLELPAMQHDVVPRESAPQLFRFGLRQLLLFVAGLSGLMALISHTEGAAPMVIGMGVVLVAGHVFGTMVGTRLRDNSRALSTWQAQQLAGGDSPATRPLPPGVSAVDYTTASPLADRVVVPWWGRLLTGAGLLLGLLLGGMFIPLVIAEPMTWSEWGIGAGVCGLLGGAFGYLAGAFGCVTRVAIKHAHADRPAPTNPASGGG